MIKIEFMRSYLLIFVLEGVLHKNWDNVGKNFSKGKVEIFKTLVGCDLQYNLNCVSFGPYPFLNFIFSKFIFYSVILVWFIESPALNIFAMYVRSILISISIHSHVLGLGNRIKTIAMTNFASF